MRILELFSGTGSFSKAAENRGHSVFTVDTNPRFKPSLQADVKSLKFADGLYDVIWASPSCQEYSHAKRRGVRQIAEANKNVLAAMRIIGEVKPKIWIIENPQTGLLKLQSFMDGLPFFDVSYCRYGMPYRKQTRIWTNLKSWRPRPVCVKDCDFMQPGTFKHIGSAGNGSAKYTDRSYSRTEKYAVPQALCDELVKACENEGGEDHGIQKG